MLQDVVKSLSRVNRVHAKSIAMTMALPSPRFGYGFGFKGFPLFPLGLGAAVKLFLIVAAVLVPKCSSASSSGEDPDQRENS